MDNFDASGLLRSHDLEAGEGVAPREMGRRGFLARVLGGVAAAVIAPFVVPKLVAQALAPGDVFSIEGVNRINPVTRLASSEPQYWQARINADGGITPENLDYWQERLKGSGGLSIRYVKQYDLKAGAPFVNRMDVIYGMATVRPEFAVRMVAD